MRPNCNNCALEDTKTKKCGNLLMPGEFSINPNARELLFNTNFRGFCEYHRPAKGRELQIDYSFKIEEVGVWQ